MQMSIYKHEHNMLYVCRWITKEIIYKHEHNMFYVAEIDQTVSTLDTQQVHKIMFVKYNNNMGAMITWVQ